MKLKVFSAATFAESEAAFNEWIEQQNGIQIFNIHFHTTDSKREITVLYAPVEAVGARIAKPTMSFPKMN
jgi:hypothetical protein